MDEIRVNESTAGPGSGDALETPPFTLEDLNRDEQLGIATLEAPCRTSDHEHARNSAEIAARPVGTHVKPFGGLGNGQRWPRTKWGRRCG